jgi:hypothetical protein
MSRRTARRPSKRKNAASRPVDHDFGVLSNELAPRPAGTPAELAKKLDEEWFRSHPYRSHRIRRAVAGEMPGVGADSYTVVRQVAPGLRMRGFFVPVGSVPEGEAPEHIAHALFDLILTSPRRLLSFQELFQVSRGYEIAPDPGDSSGDQPRYRH